MKHALQTVIEDAGYDTRSYSGRYMYGKECLGVTIEHNDLGKLLSEIISGAIYLPDSDNGITVADAVASLETDSMGRGMIVYFTDVPYCKDDDEDDATDDENS